MDGARQREVRESTCFRNAADVERIERVRSSSALLPGPGGRTGPVCVIPRTCTRQETRPDGEHGRFDTWLANLSHGNAVDDGRLSHGGQVGYHHTDGPDGRTSQAGPRSPIVRGHRR